MSHNQSIQLDLENSTTGLRIWKNSEDKKLPVALQERLSKTKPSLTKAELNLKLLKAEIKRTERLVKRSEKAHVKLAPEYLEKSSNELKAEHLEQLCNAATNKAEYVKFKRHKLFDHNDKVTATMRYKQRLDKQNATALR